MARTSEPEYYSIEPAVESDWPWMLFGQIEIAWRRLDSDRQLRLGRQFVEETVERQVASVRADGSFTTQAFVARNTTGDPVGFVWVAKDQNDATGQVEASVLHQYVDPGHRGRGLGDRLLDAAEEWACQQGLPRIALSVGIRNTLGQRLYEASGYEIETLRMSKSLRSEDRDYLRVTND